MKETKQCIRVTQPSTWFAALITVAKPQLTQKLAWEGGTGGRPLSRSGHPHPTSAGPGLWLLLLL